MDKEYELEKLSDSDLLLKLAEVLKQSRRVESVLVAHIAEVDARRLFVSQASSSMHKYCTDVLHLSGAEAFLRITAARASRRHPALLKMLDDGRLHLSGLAMLAPHLTNSNCEDLLARATHKTKGEIQKLVAEIAPKPDVAPSIRKLPALCERQKKNGQKPPKREGSERANEDATSSAQGASSGKSPSPNETSPKPERQTQDKPPVVEPLAPSRYKIQFTANEEFHDKIERLAALMPGADLVSMMEMAVTEKLERLEAKRLGKVKNPRKSVEEADTSPGVRGISAPVKRFVWERDGAQCTFERADGRRCPERRGLEFHHDDPYGFGGDRSAKNVRLLCRTHNRYMAEKDYGKEKMDQYRRSADLVREPSPSFSLFPDEARIYVENDSHSWNESGFVHDRGASWGWRYGRSLSGAGYEAWQGGGDQSASR